MSIAPGTKLGQYEVQEFIGQGAMGLVYRAYHVQLERAGAVKVLQALSPDPDTTARFRHEAQAIAQMRHSNVVNVYDFGEFEGTPYMIVEYVPGGSLADRLNNGSVSQASALKYLRGIAAGLDYAHGLGIVHRDVKPANVLLEKDDTPVLADFGLAKLMQGSSLKSMTGVTTGTPAYMAPEQVMGHQVGPAADRYSLATIAYEMLTGVIPFDGEGLMELLYAQVHREPTPPSARNAALGPEVDAVIMRGLAKDPAARWDSCTQFVDALAAALASPAVTPVLVANTTAVLRRDPLPPTKPLWAAARPALERAPATIAIPMPMPAPPPQISRAPANGSSARVNAGRPHRPSLMIAGAAILVLVLLLALGVCAAVAAQTPTLSISPSTVVAGGRVLVTASNVPANQVGEIQLHSQTYRFPFKAGASGAVSREIVVPEEIALGDHTVQLCWNSTCRAHQTLHVVARGTVLPAPVASPSAAPSATTSATPGPTPTSNPTPGSSPRPTSQPAPSPTPTRPPSPVPSPIPSPIPKPTPTPAPSITLVSVSATLNTVVTFHYFYGGTASVAVCQNGTCHVAGTVAVSAGANVQVTFKTPVGILPTLPLVPQSAYVTANSLRSGSVSVGA